MRCIVCSSDMVGDVLLDTFRCRNCGHLASAFPVKINDAGVNEDVRVYGLKTLRTRNFARLLDVIDKVYPGKHRLLDVGCAHGWFLEAASQRGHSVSGVEPDAAMAEVATTAGFEVHRGFFPDVVPPGEEFEIVTFNDVLEHVPNVEEVVRAVHGMLTKDGLLVINIPMSNGLIFKVSELAARVGFSNPLARMWQRGLPSPHINYFSKEGLTSVVERSDFKLEAFGNLEALVTEGLYERVRADSSVGTVSAFATVLAAILLKTGTGLFPSDIRYFAFRKT